MCRLAALKESRFAFGSSYDAEANRTDDEWTAWARAGEAGVDRITFFALVSDEIVGLVGGFRPDSDGFVVELVSMWASPEANMRAWSPRSSVRSSIGRGRSATTLRLSG